MCRNWFRAPLIVLALGAPEIALAQFSSPPPAYPQGKEEAAEPSAASSGKFIMIPGLVPLSMEGVRREIGLTPEQQQQLKAVSDGYVASIQRLGKTFRSFSPEEQQSRGKELGDQATQLARNAQRKAEAVLTRKQLQTIERVAFQLTAAGCFQTPACKRN